MPIRLRRMKPYDENATCPKCGHGKIATRYHEAELWGCRTCNGVTVEHLRRGCERCYYSWNEAPIHPEPEKSRPHPGGTGESGGAGG